MREGTLKRGDVIEAIRAALDPLPFVHAAWEGGAASFDRVDAWSDVDCCVDADDDRANDVFAAVEAALERLGGIENKAPIPLPAANPYVQAFYRLRKASPFLLVDLAIFRHSGTEKFLEPEIHGRAAFFINRDGRTLPGRLDRDAHMERLASRLTRLGVRRTMFANFVEKELGRGNDLEAMYNYQKILLDSLVEAQRMIHHPAHFDFAHRYLHYELPAEVVRRLVRLFYVTDREDLARKAVEAEAWLGETLDSIDLAAVRSKLDAHAASIP